MMPISYSSVPYAITVGMTTLLLFFSLAETSFSQTDSDIGDQTSQNNDNQTESSSLGWEELVALVGGTGAISAVSTGVFNRYNTKSQLKNQQENMLAQIDKQQQNAISLLRLELDKTMKETIHDKQLNEIQDRLNLYASFTFDLKRLRELIRNSRSVQQDKLDKIAEDIRLLIRSKFYLLSPEVVSGWLEVNKNYVNLNSIKSLIDRLVLEYNTEIRAKYNKLIGSDLPMIQD